MATRFDLTSQRNFEEEISGLLCNLMFFHTGANSKSVEIHKNIILIQDFLCNLRFNGKMFRHSVGSKGEGTSIEESDADDLYLWKEIMLCQNDVHEAFIWKKVMVCQSDEQVDEPNSVVFILDRTDCQPGYTKLKLVKNDMIKRALRNKGKTIMDMVEKTEQGHYLSNRKVIQFFAESLRHTKVPLNVYRHGPCATAVFTNKYDFKNEALPDQDHDHAQGFPISNMTKEGRHWLKMMDESTAERHWPSSKTIDKIRALKCEAVAVGSQDSLSRDFSLKWRISYTLWERELIWSFQDVQFHCYVFLKILLQRRLKKISDDITSFHLKNIVFWESVDCSVEILQSKTNYLLMVKKCLIRLKDAINNRRLTHFIDRNRNLFESKLTEEVARLKLIDYIDEKLIMSNKIIPAAFDCMDRDNLKALWNHCGSDPAEFLSKMKWCDEIARVGNNQELRKLKELYAYGVLILEIKSEILFDTSDEMLDMYVKNLDEMRKIDVDYDYLEITRKILKFHHKLLSSAKRSCRNMEVNDFIRNRQALYTDVLTDRLYLCTSLIRCDRFTEAERIIDDFLNSDSKLFMYCGQCSDCFGIAVARRQVTFVKDACLDVTDDPFPLVYDILVNNAHIDFFPPAIQIQISLENYLYLNPVVYMYYLKVVCDVNLNRYADHSLQSLSESVRVCGLKRDNFRHLNLLCHAYMLTKKYKDAYNCFVESVCDNLSRNVPNSVFYLLAVLVYQIQSTRKDHGCM